mmetsp:Transcript_21612/g.3532  ORF Transcript_21612/g.3532 Transcript_21612/m.3532 type:complete len:151 (+) Transcript_21612:341-793(+)
MGGGCTSGHGACGLPRLSRRSFIAVGLFMSTAFGIATLRYYYPFLDEGTVWGDDYLEVFRIISHIFVGILVFSAIVGIVWMAFKRNYEPFVGFLFGSIFGLGLVIGGMCKRSKILHFLIIGDGWDPSLAFILGTVVVLVTPVYQLYVKKM